MVYGALLWVMVSAPPHAYAEETAAERGAHLAALGGCTACHASDDGGPVAGGYPLETPFGVFYGSNLTPSPEGIGSWTFEDFERAMRHGRRPDGKSYYPAFPFTSFTLLTTPDLKDLWAWLQAQPPSANVPPPHDLKPLARGRWKLGLWRSAGFTPGPWTDNPDASDAWNRGGYLAEGILHCGECHTPRGSLGAMKTRRAYGGSTLPPEPGPNITPHPTDGTGSWSADDWDTLLTLAMLPDGDVVSGEMARVVEEGTDALSADDLDALIVWLRALQPVASRGRP